MSDGIFTDDDIRLYVEHLKSKFLGWRTPAVELPPDSLIAEVVLDIAKDAYFQHAIDASNSQLTKED